MQEIARKNRPTFYTTHPTPSNFLKEFQWLDFQQRFGDCVPICDCVSKIWHCILTKFYEIYIYNLFSFLNKDLLNE